MTTQHGKIYQMVEQEINELKSTIRHLPNPQRQEAIESVRFADYLKAKIQQLEPVWIPVSDKLPENSNDILLR
jgi:hypothetical protein